MLELKEVKRIINELKEKLQRIGVDKPTTVGVIAKAVKGKVPREYPVVTLDTLLE